MSDVEKVEAVLLAAKVLRASLQKQERLSVKIYSRKNSVEQAWLGMAIERERHILHVAVVRASIADPYPDDYYGYRTFKPDGWHEYREMFAHPLKPLHDCAHPDEEATHCEFCAGWKSAREACS